MRSDPAGPNERLRHPSCRGSWLRTNTMRRVMGASHRRPRQLAPWGGMRELVGSLGLLSRGPGAPVYTPRAGGQTLGLPLSLCGNPSPGSPTSTVRPHPPEPYFTDHARRSASTPRRPAGGGPGAGPAHAGAGDRGRRVRRGLLLGRGRRIQARARRGACGVRIRRGECRDRALRPGEHPHDGACRVGGGDVRSRAGVLRRPAARVLHRGARPHGAQRPGAGRRDAISLSHLLRHRCAAAGGARLHRAPRARSRLRPADRDRGRAAGAVLSGRGVSPELSRPPSRPAVHRLQRPAQALATERAAPRAVSAVAQAKPFGQPPRPPRDPRPTAQPLIRAPAAAAILPSMTATPPAVTVSLVTRILREAFAGPPGPWTYFTDTSPGTGVFGTIGGLSAAEASREGGPGHTTIAGHVHHLSSSLALSTLGLRGQSTSRDRGRSWTVSVVDDAAWAALRARLRDEYERLLVAVETHTRWDEDALGVAIGALAHTAYHLGAIRQRLAPA